MSETKPRRAASAPPAAAPETPVHKFPKSQFFAAVTEQYPPDIVAAVLEDGKTYTKAEAKELVDAYMQSDLRKERKVSV